MAQVIVGQHVHNAVELDVGDHEEQQCQDQVGVALLVVLDAGDRTPEHLVLHAHARLDVLRRGALQLEYELQLLQLGCLRRALPQDDLIGVHAAHPVYVLP